MDQRWTRPSRARHLLGSITAGVVVGLLLVGLGLWPFPKTWSHVGFDTALAKRLATGDTVLGPPHASDGRTIFRHRAKASH